MGVLALALLLLLGSSSFHESSAQPALSDADVNVLLDDLRSKDFFTAATILSFFVARSNHLSPGTTLLIPTDQSLAQAVSIESNDYEALIKFHILEIDFDFNQLKLLPVGTWIPTALQGYGIEVTNNSASDFSLDNAQIIDGDICPHMANLGLSCQAVSAVLNPSSASSMRPTNPPFGSAPTSASAPTPMANSPLQLPSPSPSPMASEPSASSASPLQLLSPSPSPMASEPSASVSPLQIESPSSPPSLLPSSSPSPSPSLIEPVPLAVSPSASAMSPVPSVPIFQAPIPTPISPSSPLQIPPFFAGAPGPSASETSSGALSTVASQINTLALAALGGIMLAMIWT